MRRITTVFIIAILLTGCHSNPSDEAVARILAALAAAAALKAQRTKAGTEFEHFARRRIRWLLGENSGWDTAPDYSAMTTRVAAEMTAIDSYLQAKLGTPETPGPLGGEQDNASFPHLDLRDMAKVYSDDVATAVDTRAKANVLARRQRVRRIVWRASAIHDDLWSGASSATSATLKTTALDELLDRRLRFVERMRFNDYSQADRTVLWTIAGTASWKNNMRTTLFEYPFIGLSDEDFKRAVTASGRTLATLHSDWRLMPVLDNQLRYLFRGRVRPAAAAHWDLSGYAWKMKLAGRTPAQIFDLMMPATPPADLDDFWNRNWMFCDHMAAALEVEALRLGLRRRTGSDTEFNDAADDGVTLEVPIPHASRPDPDDVMDEGDDYFEGVMADGSDLQIGDLVIIWNNWFMRVILDTDFGLENSIIADMTGDDPRHASLIGHGAKEGTYTQVVEGLLEPLTSLMNKYRDTITSTITSGDPTHDYLQTGAAVDVTKPLPLSLVYWDPFDEGCVPLDAAQKLAVPGAWWLRIKLADTAEARGGPLSLTDALRLFPKSVAVETGFHTPPKFAPGHAANYRESIYLPLSTPHKVKGGWPEYFKSVRDDLSDGLPPTPGTRLVDLPVDVEWAPGFHYAGPGTKIPVLRPKVRP